MVRLFVIAHAPLASALKAVAGHVFPEAAAEVIACDVQPEQSPEEVLAEAATLLAPAGDDELLVLADVFGATPCNVARRLGEREHTRVIVGVNVPMLWRALGHRHEPLEKMALLAVAGASQGVMQVASSRPQNQVQNPAAHDPNERHHQQ